MLIPTYNEASTIASVTAAVLAAIPADVLIIDDRSPDGTGKIADALAADPRVSVIHRPGKQGLGRAYVQGFAEALERGYDYVFQMDADGSHAPAALPELAAALEEVDLAIGSRHVRGGAVRNWSLIRRAISRAGSIYSRLLLGLPVHDATSGFKGWRASLLRRIDRAAVPSNGYVFQVEMTYRAVQAGARIREVPITFTDRAFGQSKFSPRIIIEASGRVAWLALARMRRSRSEAWQRR